MALYETILSSVAVGRKMFAVLLDPDKCHHEHLLRIVDHALNAGIDYFFLGGSLLMHDRQHEIIHLIREKSTIPVLLFPGNNMQISNMADGILLLSLISGRNAELLIGRHVVSAPFLKASGLEVLPTGYMLVESGKTTAVNYMSQTMPIPSEKNDIAVCTALAGEMLGMKLIYLDAGSGAMRPVPGPMISAVKKSIGIPLIAGGGITSPELARQAFQAGADLIVAGNIFERDPDILPAMATMRFDYH
jgi:putative glycerol-1-phosphate prenyltransferase